MLPRMIGSHPPLDDDTPVPSMCHRHLDGKSTKRKNTICRQLNQLSATIPFAKVPPGPVVTPVMHINLPPALDLGAKAEARAAWLDQVLEQLRAARDLVDTLGLPGLAQRIAQAEADAARLRRR